MPASATKAPVSDPDGKVVMHGLDWWQCEAMLATRGAEDVQAASGELLRDLDLALVARLIEIEDQDSGRTRVSRDTPQHLTARKL